MEITPSMLRRKMRVSDVRVWQVAKQIGISEITIYRWLRDDPVNEEHANLILKAIEELAVKER